MNTLLKLEELALFVVSIILFIETDYTWWVFPALLLVPDVGMIGYLINTKVGAITYNLLHHKGIALFVLFLGLMVEKEWVFCAGIILLAHSSMDRIFGYGLKYFDSFKHTHLGTLGSNDKL